MTPILTQTLYYGPGLVYTRKGELRNDGSYYTIDSWKLIENGGGIPTRLAMVVQAVAKTVVGNRLRPV